MENSNDQKADKLQKCPYQTKVYGTDNIDLNYRKAYKGDWGHWDEQPENADQDKNCEKKTEDDDTPTKI